jgi:hypothetical protein
MTTSRSVGSPSSSNGVPAATTRALSSNTRRTRPLMGDRTSAGSEFAAWDGGEFKPGELGFDFAQGAFGGVEFAVGAQIAPLRGLEFLVGDGAFRVEAGVAEQFGGGVGAGGAGFVQLRDGGVATGFEQGAGAGIEEGRGQMGSMRPASVSPAWTVAPALKGMRCSCPETGAEIW